VNKMALKNEAEVIKKAKAIPTDILYPEERAALAMRSLYINSGYRRFKLGTFEDYDFYAKYKEFFSTGGVLTFNGSDGRLLALKPDVTLSVVKNYSPDDGLLKVYYAENIFRYSRRAGGFREIQQTGVECIGELSLADISEVIMLAEASLSVALDGCDYSLCLSHMGLLTALFEELDVRGDVAQTAITLLGGKNLHGVEELYKNGTMSPEVRDTLAALIATFGPPSSVIPIVRSLCHSEASLSAVRELKEICSALDKDGNNGHLIIDFSVISDMNYYNGIVMRGYLDGIPEGVLSGGRYDGLLERTGKRASAIGFAVRLDLLKRTDISNRSISDTV
jgi:ATP phosphoribosyltransferase regulatory subunit